MTVPVRFTSLAVALLALAGTAIAGTSGPRTERVSVSSKGAQAKRASNGPSLSHTGRFVVFSSADRTLVPGDSNARSDVFVRDRTTHRTRRVSLSSTGKQGNDRSDFGSISGDGRYVAFVSRAGNLAPGDRDHGRDVFMRDLKRNKTRLVSIQPGGKHGGVAPSISADGRSVAFGGATAKTGTTGELFVRNLKTHKTERVPAPRVDGRPYVGGFAPSLSRNGRLVAFSSGADFTDPIPRGGSDVFVRDLKTDKTEWVSTSPNPRQTEGYSATAKISADGRFVAFVSGADLVSGRDGDPGIFRRDLEKQTTERIGDDAFSIAISANGRFVAFDSYSSDLVPGDTNDARDVFVRDVVSGTTTRVSVSDSGEQGTSPTGSSYYAYSENPAISGDGRFAAFQSRAPNLGKGDTNGVLDVFVRGPLRP
jgi:Tol biopolymer transport system component